MKNHGRIDKNSHEETNTPRRLLDSVNVDNGVQYSRDQECYKMELGCVRIRICKTVEEADENEGVNVLHVVHVRSTDSLDFIVSFERLLKFQVMA